MKTREVFRKRPGQCQHPIRVGYHHFGNPTGNGMLGRALPFLFQKKMSAVGRVQSIPSISMPTVRLSNTEYVLTSASLEMLVISTA